MPKSRTESKEPEITVAQAADLLRVDRKTVLRLIGVGSLTPTRKLPTTTGAYLLDSEQVEQLARERAS